MKFGEMRDEGEMHSQKCMASALMTCHCHGVLTKNALRQYIPITHTPQIAHRAHNCIN